MAPQYIVGPGYLGLPGNNERFFLLHLALLVGGLVAAVLAWSVIDQATIRPATHDADRHRSLVMFGLVAFIFGGRWFPGIIDLLGGSPSNADFQENPTTYVLIGLLDLGIVVPAALTAGATAMFVIVATVFTLGAASLYRPIFSSPTPSESSAGLRPR